MVTTLSEVTAEVTEWELSLLSRIATCFSQIHHALSVIVRVSKEFLVKYQLPPKYTLRRWNLKHLYVNLFSNFVAMFIAMF